jgi:hypothetical protein
MLGPSSLPLPRRFGFFGGFVPSTRIGSICLGVTGDRGLPTRISALSFAGFAAEFSPDRSPGVLAGLDSAEDGLGATEALSGRAGALASDATFVASGLPALVSARGAGRVGSGRGAGAWAGAGAGAFSVTGVGAAAGADVTLAVAGSFADPV